MSKLNKLALKFQAKLLKASAAGVPKEVSAPLLKVIKMLTVARNEATRGKNAQTIAMNLVDAKDALKAYPFKLKGKDMIISSLEKYSMKANDPLTDEKRGAIAGGVSYWVTYITKAIKSPKYFTDLPETAKPEPKSQVAVTKIKQPVVEQKKLKIDYTKPVSVAAVSRDYNYSMKIINLFKQRESIASEENYKKLAKAWVAIGGSPQNIIDPAKPSNLLFDGLPEKYESKVSFGWLQKHLEKFGRSLETLKNSVYKKEWLRYAAYARKLAELAKQADAAYKS